MQKILKLWESAFFWSVLLFIVLCGIGAAEFSLNGAIKAVMPFTQKTYWFLTSYLLMYVVSPYLNIAIHAMNKKQHASSIVVFFVVYICLQNLFFWKNFTAMDGQDPLFFIFLYIVAAYIRKYPFQKCRFFLGYAVCCGFIAFWTIVGPILTTSVFGREIGSAAFNGYNSVPLVLGSICFFMGFVQMRIKSEWLSRITVAFAPLTFGVYLIFVVLAFSVGVFAICAGMEKVRLLIRKSMKLELVTERIGTAIDKYFNL